MPQISKIRITNFSYNDGKRWIADELFDFANIEDKNALNTLVNLKNGGGKSVLVQLMLQPIHPKAKVAGRKIESFFTKASDHCFVIIEWFKDNSTEKLMTGIAMASGDSTNNLEDDSKGRPVKYYTFISHYSDYANIYNIVKLPLSEKVGPNFVAASFNEIREIAKKSNGLLDYYVSDDNRQWREKLAEYGIVQEEWKNIIEELNSVEGGMTEFFSKFRESDQLINQLLIPTIEGKFGQSSVKGEDSSLSTMLIEHAKAYNKQKDLISEKEACQCFQTLLLQINDMVHNVWNRNDDYEKKLQDFTAFSNALFGKKEAIDEILKSLAYAIEHAQKELDQIDYEKHSEEYYLAKERKEEAEANLGRIEAEREENKESLAETSKRIALLNCSNLYKEISDLESKLKATQIEMKAKSENDDTAERLNDLGFSVMQVIHTLYPKVKEELANEKEEYVKLQDKIEKAQIELKNAQASKDQKKTGYDRAEEAVKNACNETEKDISALNIDVVRYLDGCYRTDEIGRHKAEMDKKQARLQTDIEKKDARMKKLTERNAKIWTDSNVLEQRKLLLETEEIALQKEFDQYADLEKCLRDLCGIYTLEESDMFNGNLVNYLKGQESIYVAKKESIATKIAMIDDEIHAAQNGYVHVPKRVMEYFNHAGIQYQTCEKYLNSILEDQISVEQCLKILENYPEIAYGIILDEKEKAKLDGMEREIMDWLPSMVPVFTHAQLEEAINLQTNNNDAIAFYSVEYFSSREGFVEEIKSKKEELENQKSMYVRSLEGYEAHRRKAEEMFDFNESSRQDFEDGQKHIKDEISKIEEKLVSLSAEKNENELTIRDISSNMEECRKQIGLLGRWFEKYTDLISRLEEENEKRVVQSQSYYEYENAKCKLVECQNQIQVIQKNMDVVEITIHEKEELFRKIEGAKTELGDYPVGLVIAGEWERLLEEYRELKTSQSKAIAVLLERESNYLKEIREKRTNLSEYNQSEEDYRAIIYDDRVLAGLKQAHKEFVEKLDYLQNESGKANQKLGGCDTAYSLAEKALFDYGGLPLEKDNIQGNYAERKKETKKNLHDLNERKEAEKKIKGEVIRFGDRSQNMLEEHKKIIPKEEVILEENIENQYNTLSNHLKNAFKTYLNEKKVLAAVLNNEVLKETSYQFNEIHALKSFLKMVNNDDFKGDKYFTLSEQIEGVMKATKLRFSQIETDLEEFNKSKTDLLRQCVFQGRRIYDGLRSMAKSSAVSIVEKKPKKQMIKIDMPDEIDTNVAQATINVELDTGIQELVQLLNNNSSDADILKTANRVIGSQSLLRKYIGKDNIRVDVYKIDLNPENARYRTWRETQINSSGGEKLVSYFSLILSLINYLRSDYGDINDKSLTSVLILDNPFGAVSSGHLLKPMFEIANHFRVQLICLSDLNKADITVCFENFIKATVKPLKYSNIEMLTHEGNEAIEHGFYRSEQMSLL